MQFCPPRGGTPEGLGEINFERGQNFVDAHGADQPTPFPAEMGEEKAYGVTSPSVILELPNSKSEQPPITGEGGDQVPLKIISGGGQIFPSLQKVGGSFSSPKKDLEQETHVKTDPPAISAMSGPENRRPTPGGGGDFNVGPKF